VAGKWIYDNWNEYVGKILVDDNPYVDVWMHPPKITLMEDIPAKYRELGLWGGWRHASFVVNPGPNANSYISRVPLPKFTPLLSNDFIEALLADPVIEQMRFDALAGLMVDEVNRLYNSKKEMRRLEKEAEKDPKWPVPHNDERETWVEQLMYQMGMSRSTYDPYHEVAFPYANVGTVGHVDISRPGFIQFTGRLNYKDMAVHDALTSFKQMLDHATVEQYVNSARGPQNIEEYQEWARDWLEANDPAKQRPTIGGLFFGKSK